MYQIIFTRENGMQTQYQLSDGEVERLVAEGLDPGLDKVVTFTPNVNRDNNPNIVHATTSIHIRGVIQIDVIKLTDLTLPQIDSNDIRHRILRDQSVTPRAVS